MNQLQNWKRVLLVVGLSVVAVFALLFVIMVGIEVVSDIRNHDEKRVAQEQTAKERKKEEADMEQRSLEYFEWFDKHNQTLHERILAFDEVANNEPERLQEAKEGIYESYYNVNEFDDIEGTTVNYEHDLYANAVRKIYDTVLVAIVNSPGYLEDMHEGLEQLNKAEKRLEAERRRISND